MRVEVHDDLSVVMAACFGLKLFSVVVGFIEGREWSSIALVSPGRRPDSKFTV